MKKSLIVRLVALAVPLTLIAAACGDDGDTTSPSSSTAASSTGASSATASGSTAASAACDASKPTIKVGSVTTASNYVGMEEAIKARIERENKTCIGGRKIEFVGSRDDAFDDNKNLAGATDLVENKKADMLLITSANNTLTGPYLQGKKVPFFGWGFMPSFCGKDAYGISVNGCLSGFAFNKLKAVDNPNAALPGGFIEAHQAITGKKDYTLVIIQEDNDAGRAGGALYDTLFPKTSLLSSEYVPLKADGTVDPSQVTKYVQLVMSKNPDVTMLSTAFGTATTIGAALKAAGYKGAIQNFVSYAPGLLDSSADLAAAFEGTYTVIQYPPVEGGGADKIKADLVANGQKDFVTLGAMIGWWNMDLAIELMKTAKGNVTGESIRAAAQAGFKYGPAGGPQVSYPAGFSDPAGPCRAVVKVESKAYKIVEKYTCYPTTPQKK